VPSNKVIVKVTYAFSKSKCSYSRYLLVVWPPVACIKSFILGIMFPINYWHNINLIVPVYEASYTGPDISFGKSDIFHCFESEFDTRSRYIASYVLCTFAHTNVSYSTGDGYWQGLHGTQRSKCPEKMRWVNRQKLYMYNLLCLKTATIKTKQIDHAQRTV